MAIKGASISVEGLDDLRKELRKLDDAGLTFELKQANFDVAELVVRNAQSRAAGLGRMEGKAAASLKPSRALARAQVSGGGSSAPFFGGAEFGAGQNQVRNTVRGPVKGWNQFVPWTGSNSGSGRFLFPTIRDDTAKIVEMYRDALDKITKRAFPD